MSTKNSRKGPRKMTAPQAMTSGAGGTKAWHVGERRSDIALL